MTPGGSQCGRGSSGVVASTQARMVDDSIFSEPQGPVALEKGKESWPAERQQAVMENSPALEELAHRMDGAPQKGKPGPRAIQTAKPAAERGGIGHALGIFDRGRRS